jgi:hypothetical protein
MIPRDKKKWYISASRRTDIPRFFSIEFFQAWQKGEITYKGGYGRTYTISLKPDDVLGYIFWSKDFEPFLDHPLFEKLIRSSNAVFHFTINDCIDLEPGVPPLGKRLKTLLRLCKRVGTERVLWRFDPLCKYRNTQGKLVTNENGFSSILPHVRESGVVRCYFSFMTFYAKLGKRGIPFAPFSPEEIKDVSARMLSACSKAGMRLYNCCNGEIVGTVPGIETAHCIDDDLLRSTDRFGVHEALPIKPTREGCGCHESRDIGEYDAKCRHGCRYCYAQPDLSGT